jgi:serralysin
VFRDDALSSPHQIQGFVSGQDMIDLHQIDADSSLAGDQAFSYLGTNALSGQAGELTFAHGVLSGDTNGDGIADLEVYVSGLASLPASDIFL